jgi:hypothetical protein
MQGGSLMAKPAFSFNLIGTKEAKRFLRDFPKAVKRVQRAAVSAMATPVVKDAKRRAPKRTGALRKSMGKKVKTYASGAVIAIVGPRKGKATIVDGKIHDPATIAHIVEKHKPFLRPAVEKMEGESLRIYSDKLKDRMKAEAKKAAAQATKARQR